LYFSHLIWTTVIWEKMYHIWCLVSWLGKMNQLPAHADTFYCIGCFSKYVKLTQYAWVGLKFSYSKNWWSRQVEESWSRSCKDLHQHHFARAQPAQQADAAPALTLKVLTLTALAPMALALISFALCLWLLLHAIWPLRVYQKKMMYEIVL
jgi:hypothetical protein